MMHYLQRRKNFMGRSYNRRIRMSTSGRAPRDLGGTLAVVCTGRSVLFGTLGIRREETGDCYREIHPRILRGVQGVPGESVAVSQMEGI